MPVHGAHRIAPQPSQQAARDEGEQPRSRQNQHHAHAPEDPGNPALRAHQLEAISRDICITIIMR